VQLKILRAVSIMWRTHVSHSMELGLKILSVQYPSILPGESLNWVLMHVIVELSDEQLCLSVSAD